MNGRQWTPEETSMLRRLVAAGMTDGEIGEKMGRHRQIVQTKRSALGIAPGRPTAYNGLMARINLRRQLARG